MSEQSLSYNYMEIDAILQKADEMIIPTKTSQLQNDSNFLNNSSIIDISKIIDNSPDNANTGKALNNVMYFKNNVITNISQVYKTGFYGTKNTDTTTPYRGYWFVAVFCKDLTNQIAVQWAMDVGKAHNGELWMRTVRLNAAGTADGNYIGPWQQFFNKALADTLYSAIDHVHSEYATSATFTATIGTTWVGTEAPYTQTISVQGITATDTPIVDLVEETQSDDLEAAWGAIYRIMAGTDKITVYSKEASIISIPIQIKVVR